jgi:VWFA-related protein
MRIRLLTIVVVGLAGSLALAAAQQTLPQQPTFRSGVRIVEVDAVVRDSDDRFVANLTKDDFEVLEDDVPQEIFSVSMLNIPVDRRGRALDAEVQESSSRVSFNDIGRIYVLILNGGEPERIRRIAHEFVDEFLGPTDLMAVMHGNRAVTQGLTSDKELLLAAIDRFSGGTANGIRLIKEVAVNLNAVNGRRKAILFIGDTRFPGFWTSREVEREYNDAVRTAVRNNVRVYPIDPRGFLVRFGDMTGEQGGGGGVVASGLGEGMEARVVASDTGGIAIVNTSNYGGNFGRIVRDNSAYYVIAFYSSAPFDGKTHRLRVRLKARPELTVRARTGHQSPAPDVKGRAVKLPKNLSARARDTLRASTAADTGFPLDIFTAVFRGEGYDGSVLLGCLIAGTALKLEPKDHIELSYVAVDRWGTIRAAERRAFTVTLNVETRARVAETGLRLFGRLRLPRGTYQIRVAFTQRGGASGSALAEVEIPDYTMLPMSVSDLVVSSSRGPTFMTLEDDAVLRRALPAQPTSSRRFTVGETLSLFGEVYNGQWILTQPIGITTIIRSADGRLVMHDEDLLTSSDRGRAYYQGSLPLAEFSPGEYLLTLEAYTRNGVPTSASQQLKFEVAAAP